MHGWNRITLIGRVVRIEAKEFANNQRALKLRVRVTESVRRRGEWIDIGTDFSVAMWNDLAVRVASIVERDCVVMVEGPMRMVRYREAGGEREHYEVCAVHAEIVQAASAQANAE